jgi:hypothetical protein
MQTLASPIGVNRIEEFDITAAYRYYHRSRHYPSCLRGFFYSQRPLYDDFVHMSLDQLHFLPPAVQQAILNGPALKPPVGVIPNLTNPPNRNLLSMVILTSLAVLAASTFLLAAYVKFYYAKKLHFEDRKFRGGSVSDPLTNIFVADLAFPGFVRPALPYPKKKTCDTRKANYRSGNLCCPGILYLWLDHRHWAICTPMGRPRERPSWYPLCESSVKTSIHLILMKKVCTYRVRVLCG